MENRFICYLVNSFCSLLYMREYQDFMSIKDIRAVQNEKLADILSRNKSSEYGKLYGFGDIKTIKEFQERVPLTDYEDYKLYIEKIKRGEKRILTVEDVLLLELSSGSTSASKLIPYTKTLKEEFQKGIKPWLYDLYSSYKGIKWGRSYWSVTPAATENQYTEGGIPIGFEDDKEYFGVLEKKLFDVIFAVPSDAAKTDNIEEFYYKTALGMLNCRGLTLISVWNPSLLILILEYMYKNSEKLATDISLKDSRRAKEVRQCLYEKDFGKLWKNLKVISCWCDANAKIYADKLKGIFPQSAMQPKGLLATEGFVSFPLTSAGGAVLSVKSHFFEFKAMEDGRIFTADRLVNGGKYSVILTTSGGFYRYRLKDIIEVMGFHGNLPIIRFLGKLDKVSDLFGEKLNEVFVKDTLERHGIKEGFFMIAPETDRYVLYIEAGKVTGGIGDRIEETLRENFHYDYCRKIGQLKHLKIFKLTGNPEKEYLEECMRRGQRLGDIKPSVLHLKGGWDNVFKGEYA